MNEELQGLWFCPSPDVSGELDYYHFDACGKVVTFTPYPPEFNAADHRLAIRYLFEAEEGTSFRLRIPRSSQSWLHYHYQMVSGELVIQDERKNEWRLSKAPEAPDWLATRLSQEHQRMDELARKME